MKFQVPNLGRVDAAGAAAVAVLTAGAYFGAYAPVTHARANQAQESASLLEHRATLEQRDGELRDARAAAAATQTQLESAITLEPASRLTHRMAAFPELAEQHGVTLLETLPRAAVPGKQFVRVPLGLNGTGSYPAFTAFLAGIAARFPDIEVVSFQISGQPEDPAQPPRFGVELVWYTVADGADDAGKAGGAARGATPPG